MTDDESTDTTWLAYSGTIPTPRQQAENARRWGWAHYAEHYLRTMRAYAGTIAIESVGNPVLYLVAMGVGLGVLVQRGSGSIEGQPYLVFVAPAILVSTVIMGASGQSTYDVMAGFRWQRLYFGANATPISPKQIALGHILGGCVRYLVQAFVFWILMVAVGATRSPASILCVPIAVLGALSLAAPLTAYSATLENEGYQFSFVQRFIIMPMALFAGTYFPLGVMPVYLRWVGWISPMWHATQLARRASFGLHESPWLTVVHVVFLVGLSLLGIVWARHNYARRLRSGA